MSPQIVVLLAVMSALTVHCHIDHHHQHDGHGDEHPPANGGGNPHHCVHDWLLELKGPPQVINVSYPIEPLAGNRRFLPQQSSFSNIRVTFDFDVDGAGTCQSAGDSVTTYTGTNVVCGSNDVLTTSKRNYVVNKLMPAAKAFIESALKVVRVSGNLVVGGADSCGGITIPAADQSTGRANTDFLIYVTAVPMSDPNSMTVAWASACRSDRNGRKVVSHVNWVPSRLTNADTGSASTEIEDINTGIHEISHALGFASPWFDSAGYLAADGNSYVSGGLTSSTDATLGKRVTKMVSPRALKAAQQYFDCASLDGLEIEDQGGSGTAGSHWEKRLFYQEYMNGVGANARSFKSSMTLGFFEDTGHYQADYSVVEDSIMNWGKAKGCAFVEEKCDSTANKASGEFCFVSDNSQHFCTYDFLAIGMCDVSKYSSALPSYQQYFSDPVLGAQVDVADYCPAVIPYSNTVCTNTLNKDSQNIYGQTYSTSSRCFDSNLIKVLYSASSASARCFAASCSNGRIFISIDGKSVPCPSDGSAGNADTSSLSLSYKGYIKCPKAAGFCATLASAVAPPTSPPTPAPPTPPPTPLPPGETYAPPTPAPADSASEDDSLPARCADRVPCADNLQLKVPACREMAARLVECFGTNCDDSLRTWLNQYGFVSTCTSNRSSLADDCQEGNHGAAEVCALLSAAPGTDARVAIAALLGVLLFTFTMHY